MQPSKTKGNPVLGLPVPKALDRKGFLNIPKCNKTMLLYDAIRWEVSKKIWKSRKKYDFVRKI